MSSHSLSRRGFLTSAAAATAAVAVAVPAASQAAAPPDHLPILATFEEVGDLPPMPTSLYPCRILADRGASDYRLEPDSIREVVATFTGRRFRTSLVEWGDYAGHLQHVSDNPGKHGFLSRLEHAIRESGRDADTIHADIERFKAEPEAFNRAPAHVLDIPDILNAETEVFTAPCEITGRREAFEAAAKFNRQALTGDKHGTWAIVVEIGEPIEMLAMVTTSFAGDVGVEEYQVHHPVRVVRPTPAEIARHAKPLTW